MARAISRPGFLPRASVCQLPHDYDIHIDPDVIWDQPALAPYNQAFIACRKLEAERDELTAETERTQIETVRLAQLKGLVDAAQKMKLELDRADDPVWRERRGVDGWRSGSGRCRLQRRPPHHPRRAERRL